MEPIHECEPKNYRSNQPGRGCHYEVCLATRSKNKYKLAKLALLPGTYGTAEHERVLTAHWFGKATG